MVKKRRSPNGFEEKRSEGRKKKRTARGEQERVDSETLRNCVSQGKKCLSLRREGGRVRK